MHRFKYPRTLHLPFSPGISNDDKVLSSDNIFYYKNVIVTEKMDGENTTIYRDFFHARSLDSKKNPYQSWLAAWAASFQYMLEDNERICGEYLFAKHSIEYNNLKSYFYGFSIWHDETCLDWESSLIRFSELNIEPVPVLYEGVYDSTKILKIAEEVVKSGGEGVVVRNKDSFSYNEFSNNIAKYVRPNHVQTDVHWKNSEIKQNHLKK